MFPAVLQSAGATALGGAAALVNFTSAPARCPRTQLGAGKAKKRVLCNRETFAFSQLRKFGWSGNFLSQFWRRRGATHEFRMSVLRGDDKDPPHAPCSTQKVSPQSNVSWVHVFMFFLRFSCIHPRVLFCVFMLLCEHEAISLLGKVHLPCPRDSKCPIGCSGHVDIQSTVQA